MISRIPATLEALDTLPEQTGELGEAGETTMCYSCTDKPRLLPCASQKTHEEDLGI
jgi:hypothetical protein